MADYGTYKAFKLQATSKKSGLSTTSNKATMVKNLKAYDFRHRDTPPVFFDFGSFAKESKDCLEQYVYQIQEFCNERGLLIKGNKWQMIERILEYDLSDWTSKNYSVITEEEDPDYAQRNSRACAKGIFQRKQLEVQREARLDYHRRGIGTINTEIDDANAKPLKEQKEGLNEYLLRKRREEIVIARNMEVEKQRQNKLDEGKKRQD